MYHYDLVILPVSGLASDGTTPDTNGLARIKACAELVKSGMTCAIAISGGANVPEGTPSVAERYAQYFRTHYPDEAWTITIVDAGGNCTNRDLIALRPKLDTYLSGMCIKPSEARIGAVSFSSHLDRIKRVMLHMGYTQFVRRDQGARIITDCAAASQLRNLARSRVALAGRPARMA